MGTAKGWMRWQPLAAGALLALLALQVRGGACASSATFDEPYHLGAGYAYLKTGDGRLASDHPPLLDLWVALPLLGLSPHLPLANRAWQQAEYGSFGDVFLWQANAERAQEILWWGRLPNLALALVLGAALTRWTGRLAGRWAGLLALGLYALDPGIVAHAGLATNDLGVAALFFLAVWACWRWLEQPRAWRLVLAGAAAGAACAAKYSGLAIAPVALALALAYPRGRASLRDVALERAAGLAALASIAALTVWAAYGFALEDGLPAPAFWRGLAFQGQRVAHGQPVYALGRVWPHGVWFYYPLALLTKTPLPTLLLFALGLWGALRRRSAARLAYGLPLGVLALGVLASALQLGHRYLLPMLPFVFGLAGCAALAARGARLGVARRARCALLGLAVLWLAADAAFIYPHHLSFFNALVGGPQGADRVLVDSNLDWGQDLPALRQVMERIEIPYVRLGYFGSAMPGVYGIRYWPAPSFLRFVADPEALAFNPYTPEPGWYALSRTSLRQGLVLTHPDLYAAFRTRPPDVQAGYSINLYRLEYPPEMPIVRAVVQGERVADVGAVRLDWREGTRLIVKWMPGSASLVLAMGGAARYMLEQPLECASELEAALRASGRAAEVAEGSFEADARAAVGPLLAQWAADSSLWTPNGELLEASPVFDGRIRLLGYRMESPARAERSVQVTLAWEVLGEARPPLASFVHLLDATGTLRAQYDGWGSALSGLEPGDVVVSCVRLMLPDEAPAGVYRPQVGLYAPDTLQRWPIALPDGQQADRILLAEVELE